MIETWRRRSAGGWIIIITDYNRGYYNRGERIIWEPKLQLVDLGSAGRAWIEQYV